MMEPTPPAERDPRDRVTPDAFQVAPELLGRPLAAPWKRGMALLVDLTLIFFLTRLSGLFFAAVAAALFFYLVIRGAHGHWLRRTARATFGVAGALVFFIAVLALVYQPSFDLDDIDEESFGVVAAGQWAAFGQRFAPDDPEERLELAEELIADFADQGLTQEDVEQLVEAFDLPPGVIDLQTLTSGAAAPEEPAEPIDPAVAADTLAAYAAALRAGDEAAIAELSPAARELVAGRELARREEQASRLQRLLRELNGEVRDLRDQVENPSFLRIARAFGADLGLGFGWSGVYFTLFLALWNGRTPGKRLFRLRVVRLDHRPLGLWGAFERFAGYAAGLATGLFGFFQIFWDANRQGVQDKIVGTVVVAE